MIADVKRISFAVGAFMVECPPSDDCAEIVDVFKGAVGVKGMTADDTHFLFRQGTGFFQDLRWDGKFAEIMK